MDIDKIWNLMNMFVVIFEVMGLGILVMGIFVGMMNNGKVTNRVVQTIYNIIIGDMFKDETLE